MSVSIATARRELSHLLKQAQEHPVVITRRNVPDAVIVSYKEYKRLKRLQGYLDMRKLSEALRETSLTAEELHQASRQELEDRNS